VKKRDPGFFKYFIKNRFDIGSFFVGLWLGTFIMFVVFLFSGLLS